jgi:ethanolamine phosphate transferase 2 subunit G
MNRLLLLANLLIPVAVFIFATGFFPYKPFIPGLAKYEDSGDELGDEPPQRQFDRLVFVVIDALRSDFVFTEWSGFSFTQKYVVNPLRALYQPRLDPMLHTYAAEDWFRRVA